MKKTIICLFFLGLFAVTGIDAQTVIQGTVFDRTTREPIPGASVAIQSTATGTATDSNGAFLITSRAELPVTLFVSFLGYESQEIDVYDASMPIDVYLSDAKNYLDEVVVTALGQKRKRSALPYAVQEVNGAELNNGAISNFMNNPAVGFNMKDSPFGEDVFDIYDRSVSNTKYKDIYTGFIFYIPIEDWALTSGIPDIVTEDFYDEIIRREQLSAYNGKAWTLKDLIDTFNIKFTHKIENLEELDKNLEKWKVKK